MIVSKHMNNDHVCNIISSDLPVVSDVEYLVLPIGSW
jgi:hypothetical protein